MFMHFQMQTGVEIQSTEIKIGSVTLKEFTRYQSCHALSSGESENYAAVTTTAEALHVQRLLEFLGVPVKLRRRRFNSNSRYHPATGVRTSQAH